MGRLKIFQHPYMSSIVDVEQKPTLLKSQSPPSIQICVYYNQMFINHPPHAKRKGKSCFLPAIIAGGD